MRFKMEYQHCGGTWSDLWDCACNSQCPTCGTKDIQPVSVEDSGTPTLSPPGSTVEDLENDLTNLELARRLASWAQDVDAGEGIDDDASDNARGIVERLLRDGAGTYEPSALVAWLGERITDTENTIAGLTGAGPPLPDHGEERDPWTRLSSPELATRSAILGLNASGDYTKIPRLDIGTIDRLVHAGFLTLEDTQNDSPTAGDLVKFMRQWPGVYAHGYAIGGDRDDARISLEGLAYDGIPTRALVAAFTVAFRHADEFSLKPLRAWWD